MLQEKVSAVTDGCMSRVQDAVQPDLLSQEPRLDLSTAPTAPSASEPNQVRLQRAASFRKSLKRQRCSDHLLWAGIRE